jgi:hypothetical protein
MAGKGAETDQFLPAPEKTLLNKNGTVTELTEWATDGITNIDQMLAYFQESGVPVTSGEEISGEYRVVVDKVAWGNAHRGMLLFAIKWHFYDGENGEFVSVHLIDDKGDKWILNDGAKQGVYGQLRQITDKREEEDPESAVRRTSTAGLLVPGGMRKGSEYYVDNRSRKAIPKGEMTDFELHPIEFREKAQITWSLGLA